MARLKARYIGVNEYYAGVPARDLTVAEYLALPEAQRRLVNEGPLYEVVGDEGGETPRLTDLPLEVADALVAAGYERMSDVAGATDAELLATPGIGPARLRMIRELTGS